MDIMNFNNYNKIYESEDWTLEFDIAEIWNKYSNGSMQIQDFCKSYNQYILSRQNDIVSKFGEEIWAALEPSVQKLATIEDEKKANAIFDDIYDWADNNEVLIKTYTENESF